MTFLKIENSNITPTPLPKNQKIKNSYKETLSQKFRKQSMIKIEKY